MKGAVRIIGRLEAILMISFPDRATWTKWLGALLIASLPVMFLVSYWSTWPAAPPTRPVDDLPQEWLAAVELANAGRVPIIKIRELHPGTLDALPAPEGPFGLDFSGVTVPAAETYMSPMTDDGMRSLSRFLTLEKLDIHSSTVTVQGLQNLKQLPRLKSLRVSWSPVDDEGLRAIGECHELEELDLSGTKITDDGLRHLAALKTLCSLRLERTDVSSNGMKALIALTNLETLNLNYTAVTEVGMEYVAQLPNLRRLEFESRHATAISLKSLHSLKSLKTIWLGYPSINDVELEEVRKALPGCNVDGLFY